MNTSKELINLCRDVENVATDFGEVTNVVFVAESYAKDGSLLARIFTSSVEVHPRSGENDRESHAYENPIWK